MFYHNALRNSFCKIAEANLESISSESFMPGPVPAYVTYSGNEYMTDDSKKAGKYFFIAITLVVKTKSWLPKNAGITETRANSNIKGKFLFTDIGKK